MGKFWAGKQLKTTGWTTNARSLFTHRKQPFIIWKGMSNEKEKGYRLLNLPIFPGNSTGPIHLKAGLRPRSSVTWTFFIKHKLVRTLAISYSLRTFANRKGQKYYSHTYSAYSTHVCSNFIPEYHHSSHRGGGKIKLGWTWATSYKGCHASSHFHLLVTASYLSCSSRLASQV